MLDQALMATGVGPRSIRSFDNFERLYVIPLSSDERNLLQHNSQIQSVELDRELPFRPPVNRSGFSDQASLAPQAVTNVLGRYQDSYSASGDLISWGTLAVWGGSDISAYGNFASDSVVFVIDTGLNYDAVGGDINVATQWAKSFVGGDPLTDVNGHGTFVASQLVLLQMVRDLLEQHQERRLFLSRSSLIVVVAPLFL